MRVVLLGILDPDPPAAKAKDGQDAEAHHHALSGAFGDLDPKIIPGFVRPPRLFMHLNWGADELAWAALNREQQSSLLAELRELPDIEKLPDPGIPLPPLGSGSKDRPSFVASAHRASPHAAPPRRTCSRHDLWWGARQPLEVARRQPRPKAGRSRDEVATNIELSAFWADCGGWPSDRRSMRPGHSHVTADGPASAIGRNSARFRSGWVHALN